MILSQHTRDGDDIEVPGIVPKLSLTPGTVRTSAPMWATTPTRCWPRPASRPNRLRCCAARE